MSQGILITFEGIDGCGKSLIQRMIYDWMVAEGYQVITTFEPGGSEFGKAFRRMVLDSNFGSLDPYTETLLYIVDRSHHVEEIIRPALAKGTIVLCDRYIDSTLAYQGGGRGLDMNQLNTLNNFAIKGIRPDLTFLLTLPIDKALKRLGDKKDRLEQENFAFFQRTADVYASLAAAEPNRVRQIDATGDPDEVFALVQAEIIRVCGKKESNR
jgi:dTMP kinase